MGRQLQLIHRPQKQRWPVPALLAVGLLLNAGVLAYVFWPDQNTAVILGRAPEQPAVADLVKAAPLTPAQPPALKNSAATEGLVAGALAAQAPFAAEPAYQAPTVIVPSGYGNRQQQIGPLALSGAQAPARSTGRGRVSHLVELPLSFQRSVPDLTVNSHIFASAPEARRVMINNQNLRPGDSFQGLRVEGITENGVVLSRQGQQFRLGVVRDWVSPR